MHSYNLTLCDIPVAFRTEAGPERVERARKLVEERYGKVKDQPFGRDKLLVMLLFGMADDLLEMQERSSRTDGRLEDILQNLKENCPEEGQTPEAQA